MVDVFIYGCIHDHGSTNLNVVDVFMYGFIVCGALSGAKPPKPPPLTKITWHETFHFMCHPIAISKKKKEKDSTKLLDGVQITAVNVKVFDH